EFDVVYVPGDDEALIGGDWYDAFQIPDGRIAISIGDVTGRGLIAAVMMGKVRHSISAISYYETNPVKMLDIADATLRRRNDEVIVTAFVGLLDPKEQTFTYATAGHPAPFWKRSDGSILQLPCHGLPLGVRAHEEASPVTVRLSAADVLFLYTDGLTESTQDLIAGEKHVRRTLEAMPAGREADAAHYVLEQVLPYGSRDDVAILSVEVCSGGHDGKNELDLSFDARDLRMAHEARRVFIAYLRELGDPNADYDAAELVFGELVGNVVRHAPGQINIVTGWQDGFATLYVCDRGRGYAGVTNLPSDPLSESGRGLFLVNALTRGFDVRPRSTGGMEACAILNVSRKPE
ncbi:MAG: serine/threonine-protein phosphatase, partial [Candidatus Eremiobacteraeota bacterium]|nr:serine/threonine-protein phosphatase [Candidatus Eremiobacteraeota bacterium]